MKIVMIWIVILFPILISSTEFSKDSDVFYEGSMISVKHKAAYEGKLYFIDFYADWCASCQLMEETTFQDPQIVKILKENYIGTKVNIENFDGIALKQLYDIYILPTILIFNSKGELVERIEKAMQPSELMPILNTHNTEYNKERTETAPRVEEQIVASGSSSNTPSFQETTYTTTDVVVSTNDLNQQYTATEINTEFSTEIVSGKTSNSLFELDIKSFHGEGYSLRMGSFSSYKEMLDYAVQIEEKVIADKFINVIQRGNQTSFELYFGLFEYEYGANDFNEMIALDFQKGQVVDLNSLK